MENIRALLDRGEIDKAADALYDGLYYLINRLPNVDLTKAEFDLLIPALMAKMEDPDELTYRPTPEPGDDVVVKPAKGQVSVIFTGPPDMPLPYDINAVLASGADYEFEVPQIPGYIADIKYISGKVANKDVVKVITYVKAPKVEVEPKYGTLRVKKDNTGSQKGYMGGTVNPGEVIHAYVSGKYVKDQFDKDTSVKPEKEMPTGYWWPGITLHAPQDIKERTDFEAIPARYQLPDSNEWVNFTLADTVDSSEKEQTAYGEFNEPKPDLTGKQGDERKQLIEAWEKKRDEALKGSGKEPQSYMWVPVDAEKLDNPNGADGFYHYLVQIDWNKDGIYEQDVDIAVQPQYTYLYEDAKALESNNYIWPKKKSV